MAYAAAIIAAVQVVTSALSSFQQNKAQAASMNHQADTMLRNAQMADLQERQTYDAGLQNELAQRRDNTRQMGAVRAAVGESGFDASSGSALAVQQQSAQDLEMEALSQRYSSLIKGYQHADQARMDRYRAASLRQSAEEAKRAGKMAIAPFLLGSATFLTHAGSHYGTKGILKTVKKK